MVQECCFLVTINIPASPSLDLQFLELLSSLVSSICCGEFLQLSNDQLRASLPICANRVFIRASYQVFLDRGLDQIPGLSSQDLVVSLTCVSVVDVAIWIRRFTFFPAHIFTRQALLLFRVTLEAALAVDAILCDDLRACDFSTKIGHRASLHLAYRGIGVLTSVEISHTNHLRSNVPAVISRTWSILSTGGATFCLLVLLEFLDTNHRCLECDNLLPRHRRLHYVCLLLNL
ncbi:unnamed protein product [Moneuplotes crassus]|uniref:Uncharacterized protein n=1 Tax=Euplotes crassus TaxID=5936 RepID=A0AAD1XW24_EUPCR|nr:unnamed protein product [Moneuplotes crassus]